MNSTLTTSPSCADAVDAESISVAQALERIEATITTLDEHEELPLKECLGRISSESVDSPIDVPGHTNSAMDGFAVPGARLPKQGITEFEEIGVAYAGKPFDAVCGENQCVRIMTGALIPEGADTVIMQEQAEQLENGKIRIGTGHRPGENTRRAGEDIEQGALVLLQGASINPAHLGVLASLGIGSLKVFRKPVVAYLSTGDELVSIGKPLENGQIYDSNRYTLYGMLAHLPVEILDLGVIPDQPDKIRRALSEAATVADLIISTGGVSVGEADYIKTVLEDIGEIEFWKIAIKPGRPLTFGSIEGRIFMGLPGNPVAVMVTFDLFVIPAIRKLSGARASTPTLLKAVSQEKLRKKPGRYEIQRGVASLDANNNWQVSKSGQQGSGILTSMSRANCYIVLSEDIDGVAVGDLVDIRLFDWN
ncbi:MAG: gephyrin-like molybdotransferase Glp [Gammaproteobacteria bacterium]